MKCPGCKHDNPEDAKFCNRCGQRLEPLCPKCGKINPPGSKFCNACGLPLSATSENPSHGQKEPVLETQGERKYVTVLFSDLSGYTAMSERLDPEDVKEITTEIFGEVAKVISKYEGFVEKYAGDAVMAIFGVPEAHEDDPARAIRAALEIHDLVAKISPGVEAKIGRPLTMHTGINSGLVVTGKVNLDKGVHGMAGDTINVAARLSSAAEANNILVGKRTYGRAEGYFEFEEMLPIKAKGKEEPVKNYRVISLREAPLTLHRLTGLKADLIGRQVEMAELREAVDELYDGKGTIFSICGDAGTGKSRLIEEFKNTLNHKNIQWLEGHAYAYAQNIPYFPLINLLSRIFQINEGDPPEKIREKIEIGILSLKSGETEAIPYVGNLFSLSYPEVEDISPEFWQSKFKESIWMILASLVQNNPTVILLEDLHWADQSSVELLRDILMEFRHPALLICLYRPQFSLFSGHQTAALGGIYHEIILRDLSLTESQIMVQSLLKTDVVPKALQRFLQTKVEGNPFYLEEVINALIDSGVLREDNGSWELTSEIRESEVSSNINGVITARLDRLERESRRVLQEASVIGRSFLYDILTQITELKDQCERYLLGLERLDLIRAKSLKPDLEYIFKHALTQEVVYNSLLKKERQKIHERIGSVMEQLFQDRLPEFYETLAFHFKQGQSIHKAIDYLTRSGEKSLGRYAIDEANKHFEEAFEILSNKTNRSEDEDVQLVSLIMKWAYVYYYRGDFRGLTELLNDHKSLAQSISDKSLTGMFFGWLGMSLWAREEYRASQRYLLEALQIGEQINNWKVIGYACTWLIWTCAELGLLDEALEFGKRAQKAAEAFPSDRYLFLKSLGGIGFTYYFRGEGKNALETGKALVEFGEKNSDIRSMVMGHYVIGLGHYLLGDVTSGLESEARAVQISADPYYRQFPTLFLGIGHLFNGDTEKALEYVNEVEDFSKEFGVEALATAAKGIMGAVILAKGELKKGLNMAENARKKFLEKERMWSVAFAEGMLGQFYLQVATRSSGLNLPLKLKNIPLLMAKFPLAANKSKQHFLECIRISEEMGAMALAAESYLGLGILHNFKGRKDQAREAISKAIQLYEKCGTKVYVDRAEEALSSLG